MKKKKTVILSAVGGVVLIGSITAMLLGRKADFGEKKEVSSSPAVQVSTEGETLPHRDNEEDKKPEVIKITKKLAEEFAIAYVNLDPKQPNDYLNQMKSFTDQQLYSNLEASPRTPTNTEYKRSVLEVRATPLDDVVPHRKKWNVMAFVEVKDEFGNTVKKQMWLLISVAQKSGQWKVTGFEVNE
ncbi:hypothetical protein [Ectobacillus funiculus]|jgi:hypothetical protein|uniref:DUF4829 domain-containing protein n=1 Tax=Ectobacillus funiculus TaxID=137993 RepID=A0ABV5W9Y6_9BACI